VTRAVTLAGTSHPHDSGLRCKIKPKPAQACAAAGNHQLFGVTDANGPHNQEVQFPVPPLPSSTMAFDGRQAVFAGTDKLKLKAAANSKPGSSIRLINGRRVGPQVWPPRTAVVVGQTK
jgi:hypothetical protein